MRTRPLQGLAASFIVGVLALAAGLVTSPPAVADESLTHTITYKGETVTLDLTMVPVRTPGFDMLVQREGGVLDDVTDEALEESSYMGTVREDPAAYATATVMENGEIWAMVVFDRGVTWYDYGSLGLASSGTTTTVDWRWPERRSMDTDIIGDEVYQTELVLDVPNVYLQRHGGDLERTQKMAEFGTNNTRATYIHDVGVAQALDRLIIRTDLASDPYAAVATTPGDPSSSPNAITRNQFFNVLPNSDQDTMHLMWPNGASYSTATRTMYERAYNQGWNTAGARGNFDNVWRHEMGHNWSLIDGHGGPIPYAPGAEGATIMSTRDLTRFDMSDVYGIGRARALRAEVGGPNGQPLLTNLGSWTASPVAPYATGDVLEVVPGDEPQRFDVLANDRSAMGNDLELVSVQETSDLGASVSTNNDGTISYTPLSETTDAIDHVAYRVRDSDGLEATGALLVRHGQPFAQYEAEDAVTSGTREAPRDGTSQSIAFNYGTGYWEMDQNNSYVEYTIDVPADRTYSLDFGYEYTPDGSDPATIPVQLSIDGEDAEALEFPSSNRFVRELSTEVELEAGEHVVRITHPSVQSLSARFFQDYMQVTAPNAVPALTDGDLPSANSGAPYAASLVDVTTDGDLPADTLTYEKVSGPAWLSVGSDGELSGTPGAGDVGSQEVVVRVADAWGTASSQTFSLSVAAAQDVTAGGPYAIAEGDDLQLVATGGSDVSWDVNGDGDFSDATGQEVTLTPTDLAGLDLDGEHAGDVTARFADVGSGTDATTTLDLSNVAPTATIAGDNGADVGDEVTLQLGADDPSPLDQAEGFDYTIDWGDGSTEDLAGGEVEASHVYDEAGIYTATVTATDRDGSESAPVTTPLTITPAVIDEAGGPYAIAEGDDLILSASGVGEVSWDVDGDGDFTDATGDAATLTPDDLAELGIDGDHEGSLSARFAEEDGTVTDVDTTLEVSNIAPTASITGDGTVTAGEEWIPQLAAEDPSPLDTAAGFGYSVDWGDGTEPDTLDGDGDGASVPASHTYEQPGTYTVTATATDRDGGQSDPVSTTVTVDAVPVERTAGGPYTLAEGTPLVLDAAGEGNVTWDVDNDGSFDDAEGLEDTLGAEQLAELDLDGPYDGTLTARFTDEDGITTDVATTLTVTSVAPTAVVDGPTTIGASEPLALQLAATDPSPLDAAELFDYTVDWGDGTEPESVSGSGQDGPTVEHTYADPGTYTIEVTATDRDGDTSETLAKAVEVIFNSQPSAGGPYELEEGGDLELNAEGPSTVIWDLNGDGEYGDASGLQTTVDADALAALDIDGPYDGVISARFVAEDGTTTDIDAPLTVDNVAPTAFITDADKEPIEGTVESGVGEEITVNVGADDPSPQDALEEFTYRLDWGDGTAVDEEKGPADPPFSHIFTEPGTYTLTVTATDRDGGTSDPVTQQIRVTADDPGPTPEPTDNPTGNPTEEPTENPTGDPTGDPTRNPTGGLTGNPTAGPGDGDSGPRPEDGDGSSPDDGGILARTGATGVLAILIAGVLLVGAGVAALVRSRHRKP